MVRLTDFDKPRFLTNQKAVRTRTVRGFGTSPSNAETGECGSRFPHPIPFLKKVVNKAKSGQVLRRGVITQREA